MKKDLNVYRKILSILCILILGINSISYAGLFDSCRAEAPNRPASAPASSDTGSISSGDSSSSSTSSSISSSTTETTESLEPVEIEIPYYIGISGNVYEDLKLYDESIGDYNTNGEKDDREPGIKNMIVQVVDESDNVLAQTTTDENGYYNIPNIATDLNDEMRRKIFLEDGGVKCKLRYIYGLIRGDYEDKIDDENVQLLKELDIEIDQDVYYNEDEIKSILKYNGNDYFGTKIETQIPSVVINLGDIIKSRRTKTFISSYENHIITSGKGCSQIYLVIDCSYSMQTETTINDYGEEVLKMSLIQEAAKSLVNELLAADENIYIGIVGFGEVGVRRQGLTNNKEVLENAIDNILNLEEGESFGSLTNIMAGLTTAEESFINSDSITSNRSIVLLSDGIPTAIGYKLGSASTILNGILQKDYAVQSIDDLTEISREKSINFEYIYSDDSDEVLLEKLYRYVEQTNELLTQLKAKGINISTIITKTDDVEEDILIDKMTDTLEYTYTTSNLTEIKEIFETEIIKIIKDNIQENTAYINSFTRPFCYDNQARREQVNRQYANYNYFNLQEFKLINEYNHNEDLERAKEFSLKNFMYVETDCAYAFYTGGDYPITYENQNVFLTRRNSSMLEIEKIATAFRVKSADGQILLDNVCEEAKIDFAELNQNNMNNTKSDLLTNLKNISTIKDREVETYIGVVDEELIYGATVEIEYAIRIKNTSSLTFNNIKIVDYLKDGFTIDPTSQLLTEDATNAKYGWGAETVDESKLSQELKDDNLSYSIATLNNTKLGNNGERYVKVLFSTLLTNEFDDWDFFNEIEVYEYSNSGNRRMEIMLEDTTAKEIIGYEMIYPADRQGPDYDESIHFALIPPLGKDVTYYGMVIALGMFFVAGLIFIKKKVLK